MFLCLDCDAIFVKPKKYTENHGFDNPPYEEYYGCPACGCGGFVNAIKCSYCGNYITGYYAETADGGFYCEDCCDVKHIENMEVRFD